MGCSGSFAALGGVAIVAVADPTRLAPAERAVRDEVAALDAACSRFREDSELSQLNRAAGAEVSVGGLLFAAVQAALGAAQLTGGTLDPTIGATLIALGYDRDFDQIDRTGQIDRTRQIDRTGRMSFLSVPGWRSVRTDTGRRTVRVPAGVALDLGATAKALGADRAARRASAEAGCGVLAGLSGDIALAGEAPAGGWRVRVTDDHRAGTDAPGQWITISSGGLASSSTTARRWRSGDETFHHLIDPSTGRPAAGPWRTVSVAAASCLEANIASSTAVIRGHDALTWLRSLELPSRLVSRDGVATHVAGWPAKGDDLAPLVPPDRSAAAGAPA